MGPGMASGERQSKEEENWTPKMAARSPLAQLLHALNQPLTGLQCSMEVALASPRTPEQYVRGLREGLELTERMRALVEAIREVTDLEEESEETEGNKTEGDKTEGNKNDEAEAIQLNSVLPQIVDDLAPVAEVKNVRITLNRAPASSLAVRAGQRKLATAVFRFLESALSLAARGSILAIEVGGGPGEAWFRVRWHAGRAALAFSRPELGLLVAQAGLEHAGGIWERERTENLETVTVRLPVVPPLEVPQRSSI
jgi:signal transduction histidine kinase